MFDLKDTAVLMYKASTCCTYILHFTWDGFGEGFINSLRSRRSAARSARINTFIILQSGNLTYKACLIELFDH